MSFTDIASQYLQNRWDQATQPFTDPEGYMDNRFGNVKPRSTTISYDEQGKPASVTTKHDISTETAQGQAPVAPVAPATQSALPEAPKLASQAVPPQPIAPVEQTQPAFAPYQVATVGQTPPPPSGPVAPTATTAPDQSSAETARLMQQEAQASGTTQAPATRSVAQGPVAPGQPQTQPQTQVQNETAPAPAPQQGPTAFDTIANEQDLTKRYTGFQKLAMDPNINEGTRKMAATGMMETLQRQQAESKAMRDMQSMSPNDLARALKKDTEEGSFLKYYLAKRLGLDELAGKEANKLGYTNVRSAEMLPDGTQYYVERRKDGTVVNAMDTQGNYVPQDTLSKIAAESYNAKGVETGQTFHKDPSGNIWSHTILPGGRGVVWTNQNTGERQSTAPTGLVPLGQTNPLENRIIQGRNSILSKMQKDNQQAIATTGKPLYTQQQMDQAGDEYEMRMRHGQVAPGGASATTPTAPGAVPNAPTPTAPTATGGDLSEALQKKIVSGQRSRTEQQTMYDETVAAGRPGIGPTGLPVAQVSEHETGNAIDLPRNLSRAERAELAQKGWFQPDPAKDPVHWVREGGGAPVAGATVPAKSQAQKIADYELPPPTRSNRDPGSVALRNEVLRLNPNYDESKWDTAKKTRQAFTTGKQGDAVRAMNTAIDHLDTLNEAGKALQNGNVPIFNKYANDWARNTGQAAPTNFEGIRSIVGGEVAKAIQGGATALGDREEIRKEINSASSPQQLAGIIDKYQHLLAGQVKGLRTQYQDAGLKDFDNKLNPRTKKVLQGVEQTSNVQRGNW